jgi:ABC-type Fe3+/spermidine/putrescine transport system ATPase subunit
MTFIIVTHDQEEAMTVAKPDRRGWMTAVSNSRNPARALRGALVALVAEFVVTSICSRDRSSRARRVAAVSTRVAGTIMVAEPRKAVTKTIVAVAYPPEKGSSVPATRPGFGRGAMRISINRAGKAS